jgi:hypothetical protein
MYQQQYWKEFYQLKVHTRYLDIYREKSEAIDKGINIFLAVTSSSSICSWAIWQKYNFVWAFIIALSQLITAIKMFLPYKNRLKVITGLQNEFEEIADYCELRWFDVAEGKLTSQEIHELRFTIKQKINKALRKHIGTTTLPIKKSYFKVAQRLTRAYFQNFYQCGENQND